MHSYAQTNIQLFNQLQRDGYSKEELVCISKAYELAMRLVPGLYSPSGKTFIAHLVGTASILASLHAPAKVVAAGVIHAIYAHGDFGSWAKGISDAKREQVRPAVGKEVEEYVYRYTAMQWNSHTIPTIRDRLDELDPIDRDVVLMRLVNELEILLDLGVVYWSNAKRHNQYIQRMGHMMIEIAKKLSFPTLAAELEEVFRETALAEIPEELRNQSLRNTAFLIAPKSYHRRLPVAFYQ